MTDIARVTVADMCDAYGLTRQTVCAYRRNDPTFPKAYHVPKKPRQFSKTEVDEYFAAKDCRHDDIPN